MLNQFKLVYGVEDQEVHGAKEVQIVYRLFSELLPTLESGINVPLLLLICLFFSRGYVYSRGYAFSGL